MTRTYQRRHQYAWDLRGVTDGEQRRILQDALNACDYPFSRIRRRTGKRVPVTVTDLSRYNGLAAEAATAGEHAHVHSTNGSAHLLGTREGALGLYWLPTAEHPAGRVEIGTECFSDQHLAREVFLAEAAHAVDYGAMTDEQRRAVFAAYHGGDASEHGTHGWFEERGGHDYWSDWVGESFMAGFMAAFAPSLPRPLEQRQPWTHPTTPDIARQIRELLA